MAPRNDYRDPITGRFGKPGKNYPDGSLDYPRVVEERAGRKGAVDNSKAFLTPNATDNTLVLTAQDSDKGDNTDTTITEVYEKVPGPLLSGQVFLPGTGQVATKTTQKVLLSTATASSGVLIEESTVEPQNALLAIKSTTAVDSLPSFSGTTKRESNRSLLHFVSGAEKTVTRAIVAAGTVPTVDFNTIESAVTPQTLLRSVLNKTVVTAFPTLTSKENDPSAFGEVSTEVKTVVASGTEPDSGGLLVLSSSVEDTNGTHAIKTTKTIAAWTPQVSTRIDRETNSVVTIEKVPVAQFATKADQQAATTATIVGTTLVTVDYEARNKYSLWKVTETHPLPSANSKATAIQSTSSVGYKFPDTADPFLHTDWDTFAVVTGGKASIIPLHCYTFWVLSDTKPNYDAELLADQIVPINAYYDGTAAYSDVLCDGYILYGSNAIQGPSKPSATEYRGTQSIVVDSTFVNPHPTTSSVYHRACWTIDAGSQAWINREKLYKANIDSVSNGKLWRVRLEYILHVAPPQVIVVDNRLPVTVTGGTGSPTTTTTHTSTPTTPVGTTVTSTTDSAGITTTITTTIDSTGTTIATTVSGGTTGSNPTIPSSYTGGTSSTPNSTASTINGAAIGSGTIIGGIFNGTILSGTNTLQGTITNAIFTGSVSGGTLTGVGTAPVTDAVISAATIAGSIVNGRIISGKPAPGTYVDLDLTGLVLGIGGGAGAGTINGTLLTGSILGGSGSTFIGGAWYSLWAYATVGIPFSYAIQTVGPVSSIFVSGLPPGLTYANGVISGTPTDLPASLPDPSLGANARIAPIIITATSASNVDTKTLALTVTGYAPFLWPSTRLYNAAYDVPPSGGHSGFHEYKLPLAWEDWGLPTTYALSDHSQLPKNFTITSDGVLHAVPATYPADDYDPSGFHTECIIQAGDFAFIVIATNEFGQSQSRYQLTIQYPTGFCEITATKIPNAIVGVAYSFTLAATTGPLAPWFYDIDGTGITTGDGRQTATMNGIVFYKTNSNDLSNRGKFIGTPTAAGHISSINVTPFNSSGPGASTVAGLDFWILNPTDYTVLNESTIPEGAIGSPYSTTVTATNHPDSFTSDWVDGTYGLTFDTATGTLSGTPTAGSDGTYPITITPINVIGSGAPVVLSLVINTVPTSAPTISTTSVPNPSIGIPYNFAFAATNFPTGWTTNWVDGNCGLYFDTVLGRLYGTPTSAATGVAIGVTATNGIGSSAQSYFTFNIV